MSAFLGRSRTLSRPGARRNTLDDDEVKEQFISALDGVFYAPVVSRLFTHQQRATVDLLTMQQWVSECYARHVQAGTHTALSAAAVTTDCDGSQLSDLTAIILDVKLTDKVNGKGFTLRADKDNGKIGHGGGGSGVRFAARDLPAGGNWSQTQTRKRAAFHKGSGDFIPFCGNETCKKDDARHWHRDCPNGGKHGAGGHFGSFSLDDVENDLLSEQFQVAMDDNDDARFDALCLLAGGRPEMLDGVSACSFGVVPEQVPGALLESLSYCQPATHMGGFTVGGVAGLLGSITSEGAGFAPRYMYAGSEDGSDGSDADGYADEDASADEMASPEMPSRGYIYPVPVFPPRPGLDSPPPSPDYSPGPTDDEAEASIDDRGGVSSYICSTNDSTPTTTFQFGGPLTVLRAGTAVHPPTSGRKVDHAGPAL
ncbi:hypothetical protein CYMTET_29133 [Cymbomonas tetramitiformis]|uniref:Uncharacterized protein n=1 Tax=Cymbomonas tetramitiformis TaxID=36881 RepID=A0AAE0FLW2_9CHLO|nr:hypothetical protein CYMTET_29133 [Cymbomonas tetramitiformis]